MWQHAFPGVKIDVLRTYVFFVKEKKLTDTLRRSETHEVLFINSRGVRDVSRRVGSLLSLVAIATFVTEGTAKAEHFSST